MFVQRLFFGPQVAVSNQAGSSATVCYVVDFESPGNARQIMCPLAAGLAGGAFNVSANDVTEAAMAYDFGSSNSSHNNDGLVLMVGLDMLSAGANTSDNGGGGGGDGDGDGDGANGTDLMALHVVFLDSVLAGEQNNTDAPWDQYTILLSDFLDAALTVSDDSVVATLINSITAIAHGLEDSSPSDATVDLFLGVIDRYVQSLIGSVVSLSVTLKCLCFVA